MTAVHWIPKYSRYSAVAPDGAQSPGDIRTFISGRRHAHSAVRSGGDRSSGRLARRFTSLRHLLSCHVRDSPRAPCEVSPWSTDLQTPRSDAGDDTGRIHRCDPLNSQQRRHRDSRDLLVSTIVATRVREWAHAVGRLGPRTKSRAKRDVNDTA